MSEQQDSGTSCFGSCGGSKERLDGHQSGLGSEQGAVHFSRDLNWVTLTIQGLQ